MRQANGPPPYPADSPPCRLPLLPLPSGAPKEEEKEEEAGGWDPGELKVKRFQPPDWREATRRTRPKSCANRLAFAVACFGLVSCVTVAVVFLVHHFTAAPAAGKLAATTTNVTEVATSTKASEVECSLRDWGSWSSCGGDCRGSRSRRRSFASVSGCGEEDLEEREDCSAAGCVCDWAPWADCSATCGKGRQQRRRLCGRDAKSKSCWAQPCPTTTTRAPTTPPPAFRHIHSGGKVYHYHAGEMTEGSAANKCDSFGWELGTFPTVGSINKLKAALRRYRGKLLTHGAIPKDATHKPENFRWYGGPWSGSRSRTLGPINKALWRYEPWLDDEKCVEVDLATARLDSINCDHKRPFVCLPIATTPPPKIRRFGGEVYVHYSEQQTPMVASKICRSMGWELATFPTLSSLYSLRTALRGTDTSAVLVHGGVEHPALHKVENFYWTSGPVKSATVLGPINPALWGKGQPDGWVEAAPGVRVPGMSKCVEVDLATARLNDIRCWKKGPFLCVKP